MADTAYQKQYRQEFILGFEDRQTILRAATVQEANVRGNEAIFLVVDSGQASAVSRGQNGLIPARADNNTQNSCVLTEWHDLVRKTQFNVMSSQGDQRRVMQETTMAVLNRKIDDVIIAQLDTATNDTGTSQTASLDLVAYARTILGNNFVDITDTQNMFGLISPAFESYLMQIPEFASADYVPVQPLSGPARRFRQWFGVNWMVHPRLTGSVGAGSTSATENCYMFHRNAIGCAVHMDGIQTAIGFDEEQAYSYCRVSFDIGAKLLQNSGIVQMKHNGSAYVAQ